MLFSDRDVQDFHCPKIMSGVSALPFGGHLDHFHESPFAVSVGRNRNTFCSGHCGCNIYDASVGRHIQRTEFLTSDPYRDQKVFNVGRRNVCIKESN